MKWHLPLFALVLLAQVPSNAEGLYGSLNVGDHWTHRHYEQSLTRGTSAGGAIGYQWYNGVRTELEVMYNYSNARYRAYHHTVYEGNSQQQHLFDRTYWYERRHRVVIMANLGVSLPAICSISPYILVGIGSESHPAQDWASDFAYQGVFGVEAPVSNIGCLGLRARALSTWLDSYQVGLELSFRGFI